MTRLHLFVSLFLACAVALSAGVETRSTLAITYPEGRSTAVDLIRTGAGSGVQGRAEVKRKAGRTTLKVRLEPLPHPQSLGPAYTTFLLWAVAPEGRAESLAELVHGQPIRIEVTTALPAFGLVVTAEPHAAVTRPGPLLVAENVANEKTLGLLHTARIEYGGAAEVLPPNAARDHVSPLPLLGARHAVELATLAGADRHAAPELGEAQGKLRVLQRTWPAEGRERRELESAARDVMRVAENARALAEERGAEAALEAERAASNKSLARAQHRAEEARAQARDAQGQAFSAEQQAEAARRQAEDEARRAERARSEADVARLGEAEARAQAESAQRQAEEAKALSQQAQQRLFESLSAILETRREARGLIVSMSDVLFDFGRAGLTPVARERLGRLSGALAAYPGNYRISTEGHTDSVGSADFNLRLSQERAQNVLGYLAQAGVSGGRLGGALGLGESRPVADNASAAGRQANRRVEIVIGDLDI